jgi:hypothetical protein
MTEVIAPPSATRAVTGGVIRSPVGCRATPGCAGGMMCEPTKSSITGSPLSQKFRSQKRPFGRGPRQPVADSQLESDGL